MATKLVGRAEAAQRLRITPGHLSRVVADGCPVTKGGGRGLADRYDVNAIGEWRRQRAAARRNGHALSLEGERAGLARAQRVRVELQNQQRRGEPLPRAVYERELFPVMTEFRTKTLAAPRAWAPTLTRVAAEGVGAVERELTLRVRELLMTLAGLGTTLPTTREPAPRRKRQ